MYRVTFESFIHRKDNQMELLKFKKSVNPDGEEPPTANVANI